jgi:hypothetical protein
MASALLPHALYLHRQRDQCSWCCQSSPPADKGGQWLGHMWRAVLSSLRGGCVHILGLLSKFFFEQFCLPPLAVVGNSYSVLWGCRHACEMDGCSPQSVFVILRCVWYRCLGLDQCSSSLDGCLPIKVCVRVYIYIYIYLAWFCSIWQKFPLMAKVLGPGPRSLGPTQWTQPIGPGPWAWAFWVWPHYLSLFAARRHLTLLAAIRCCSPLLGAISCHLPLC